MIFVIAMAVKLFVFDVVSWKRDARLCDTRAITVFATARYGCWISGRLSRFLCGGYYLLSGAVGGQNARLAANMLGAAALALLFIFLSLEVNTILDHYVPGMRAGGYPYSGRCSPWG